MLALVLAGGDNTRYPTPKGLIAIGGRSIIQRQIDMLNTLGLTPHVSTNTPDLYAGLGVPLIGDSVRRAGPVSGIISAFDATGTPEMLVMACDMPFIKPEMIQYIIEHRGGEATVPAPGGRPEPLLAVYTDKAAGKMRRAMEKGNSSMRGLLGLLEARLIHQDEICVIDPEGVSFVNINTPEDYRAALARQPGT